MTVDICQNKTLCVDCKDKSCDFAGKLIADCPKFSCDRPQEELYEDCKSCAFLRLYQKMMREMFELQRKDEKNGQ